MQLEYELVKKIYPKKLIDYYIKKGKYFNKDIDDISSFLLLKLFLSIIIFFFAFFFLNRHISLAFIVLIIFNVLYNYLGFTRKVNLKRKKLESDANIFFEVLILSLKSGKNLNDALKITIDNTDNLLKKEFVEIYDEIKYGKTLHEALLGLREKIPSDNINNIITNLCDNYISGKDMILDLEKQLDILNNKRIYEIKSYINRLPIVISVISVILLIPLMLLLVLSPVIIEYFG